jgi:hypothetical protein
MPDKVSTIAVLSFLIVFDGLLFSRFAGVTSLIDSAVMAPFVLAALAFGVELCRQLGLWILNWSKIRGGEGHLLLLLFLVVMPLPLTFAAASANLLFPGHVGAVHGIFQAWRAASSLCILNGILALCRVPVSLQGLGEMIQRAFSKSKA